MEQTEKSKVIKYLAIFSIAVIILSIFTSAIFGTLAAFVIAKYNLVSRITNQPVKVTTEESSIITSVKSANPAVVSIVVSEQIASNNKPLDPSDPFGNLFNGGSSKGGSQQVGQGSGFLVSADGYIVTNKHVAPDTTNTYKVILSNGKKYDGTLVASDPTGDISVMKINANNLPFLKLSDSSSLQLGQMVIAIGNALGQYKNSVSVGVVSGLNRSINASDANGTSSEKLSNMIQTDASINPGNSGGPLLNLQGEVVGINTAVADGANGIGFAIPINQAKADITSVEKNGKITKPQLGLRYIPIDSTYLDANPDSQYKYGALVSGTQDSPAIISDSPADKAGIKEGDIILDVDSVKVDTSVDSNALTTLIQQHSIGDAITLHIYQASSKKEIDVKVKLTKSF